MTAVFGHDTAQLGPVIGLVATLAFFLPSPARASQDTPFGKVVTDIQIHSLSSLDEERVIRELASKVGEPYREDLARKDRERLDRLGIFSAIEMRPTVSADRVILHVDVKETLPYLPTVSLDVSDENGVSVGPGFKAVNFLQTGAFLSAAARFGGTTQVEIVAEGRWVSENPFYQLQFFYRDRRNTLDDFDESALELDLRVGSYVAETMTLGAQLGFLSLGSGDTSVTLASGNRDTVAAVGAFVGQDSIDSRSNPRRGWLNELAVSRHRGSGFGFWKLVADVRRFQPLAERHTLAFSSLTTLQSGVVGVDLPVYQDFHLGGTNTVRGWGLGEIEGKHQHITTAEYRYTLLEPRDFTVFGATFYVGVQGAAFGELGVAWDGERGSEATELIDGYGFGIRLLVPFVDIVRFDFGFGEPGAGLRRHVGVTEKATMQRRRVR